ncbi:MAG: F0F1 ATP synthase subunit B [Ignavibacteria bacterium]|nr:F0F1 ATP synthase subunit B [Ignavibacteria bacterium]
MDALLSIKPGLIFWSLVNFGIFLFILIKFGAKPISNALKAREERIKKALDDAAEKEKKAEELVRLREEKLNATQNEIAQMLADARQQSELHIKRALEEADKIKNQKIEEAQREINRSKNEAISELRKEVANLVVLATEKILEEKIDAEKDYKIIENYIQKMNKN